MTGRGRAGNGASMSTVEGRDMEPVEERPVRFFVRYVLLCWGLVVLFAGITVFATGGSRFLSAAACICFLVVAVIVTAATRRVLGRRTQIHPK